MINFSFQNGLPFFKNNTPNELLLNENEETKICFKSKTLAHSFETD